MTVTTQKGLIQQLFIGDYADFISEFKLEDNY